MNDDLHCRLAVRLAFVLRGCSVMFCSDCFVGKFSSVHVSDLCGNFKCNRSGSSRGSSAHFGAFGHESSREFLAHPLEDWPCEIRFHLTWFLFFHFSTRPRGVNVNSMHEAFWFFHARRRDVISSCYCGIHSLRFDGRIVCTINDRLSNTHEFNRAQHLIVVRASIQRLNIVAENSENVKFTFNVNFVQFSSFKCM